MISTRTRWLPAIALALGLAFASTGLNAPQASTKAPASQEATQSDLGPLDDSVAIELVLPSTTLAPTTTSTTASSTTATTASPTTAPPESVPVSESNPIETGVGNGDPSDYASWDRLAQCESGGDWSINTGNGYFGGLQFSLASWRAVGGTGYPHEHPRADQIEMGQRLHAQGGWGHWPGCTRAFGWR